MTQTNFYSIFEQQAALFPEACCIVDSNDSFSYRDILLKTHCLVERILPLAPQQIAILLKNNHDYLVGYLTASFLDLPCILVPQQANTVEIGWVLDSFPDALWLTYRERELPTDRLHQIFYMDSSNNPELRQNPVQCGYSNHYIVNFTSGTTGKIKPIMRNNQSILEEAESIVNTLKLTRNDRIMTILPLSYAFSFGTALLASIYTGASLYVFESSLPFQVLNLLVKNQITMFLAVPYFYYLLNRSLDKHSYVDLSFIRYLISSGAELDTRIQKKLYPKINKKINVQFGSSETGALFINGTGNNNSLGRPYDGIQWHLDAKTNELIVFGRTFSFNSPKVDRLSGQYSTGDIVRIKNSEVFFIKRKDTTINRGSQKTTPEEIESILKCLNYVKLAKIRNNHFDKIIAHIVVDKDVNDLEVKRDLKRLTMDFKIPSRIVIEKRKIKHG